MAIENSNNSAIGGTGASLEVTEGYRRYVLFMLLMVFTFSHVDRHILAAVLELVKDDLDLSDTQLGFLTGFAFALFYATLAMPMAMWADRHSRKNLIIFSLSVWSLLTMVCGLTTNFIQLAVARIGVSIGEAGSSPPSHSMIADIYPPERRATAMAMLAIGVNIGLAIGFSFGAWVGEHYGWQMAFFAVGGPGLLLALLLKFTLREPPRGHADGLSETAGQLKRDVPLLKEVFARFWKIKSLRHLIAGATLNVFVAYGVVAWTSSFLIRSHGMSISEAGFWIATIAGFGGFAGTLVGGYLSDQVGRNDARRRMWLLAAAAVIMTPFYVAFLLVGNTQLALMLWTVPIFIGHFYLPATFAMVQGLAPLRMRSVSAAILFFVLNIIGLGLGPQSVGVLSDMLAPDLGSDSLRYAMLMAGTATLWAAVHYTLSARTLRADLEATTSSDQSAN
ncbi:MAG TPA: MFS transporter [Sneathiellales bacterium]|nr:MFS transporter [Sneathiellales bacterium]